jgi:hypothetical protein
MRFTRIGAMKVVVARCSAMSWSARSGSKRRSTTVVAPRSCCRPLKTPGAL